MSDKDREAITFAPYKRARPAPATQRRRPRSAAGPWSDKALLLRLVAIYVVLMPVQIRLSSTFRLAPSDFALVAIVLFCFNRLRVNRQSWSGWHVSLLLLILGSGVVTGLVNGGLGNTILINKMTGIVALFVAYIAIVSAIQNTDDAYWLAGLFTKSVVITNLAALVAWLLRLELPFLNTFGGRLSGMLVDPNAYGGLLVVALALHLATSQSRRPLLSPALKTVATVTLPASIILTSSRSAWIGLGFLIVILAIARPKLWMSFALKAGAALLALGLVVGSGAVDDLVNVSSRTNTISERVQIIEDAVDAFASSPLYGIGLGMFSQEHGIIVHNTLMWFLAEFGVLGLIVLTGFLAWFALRARALYVMVEEPLKSLVLGLGLAHAAMIGLSLGIEALYQRHWWFVMAMIAVLQPLLIAETRVPPAPSRPSPPPPAAR